MKNYAVELEVSPELLAMVFAEAVNGCHWLLKVERPSTLRIKEADGEAYQAKSPAFWALPRLWAPSPGYVVRFEVGRGGDFPRDFASVSPATLARHLDKLARERPHLLAELMFDSTTDDGIEHGTVDHVAQYLLFGEVRYED